MTRSMLTKLMLLTAVCAGAIGLHAEAQGAGVWPAFRGLRASGVADGENLPVTFDAATGENIRWKKAIPGLAHSSPIVWGGRVFVTTAVSGQGEATFKPGLYGEGTASEDRSVHKWIVMALDAKTGETAWARIAFEGEPREKRHIKSTYASATPVTDGKVVVAFFGSQGLHAFSFDGTPLWSKDLGRMDVGAYDIPSYEWGTASSPALHAGRVIVQVDTSKEDFLAAFDAATGAEIWRTTRDELPSWGTPAIVTDGHIYASSEDGDVFVVKTGAAFEVLAQNALGEPIMATPAIAGGTLFVRGQKTLFAIGKK